MSKDNVIDFADYKMFKDAFKAVEDIEAILTEAQQYADDPQVAAFIKEADAKMQELINEAQSLEKDIQELKKLEGK